MNPPNPAIIEALQAALRAHWTAIEAYTTQATHFARWGYGRLATAAAEDAAEERTHCNRLLERLETFAVPPAYDHAAPVWPAGDIPGILAANLALETAAAAVERAGIETAREFGDEITAKLLGKNLAGSEESIRTLEAQQFLITQTGLQNWLTTQI